MRRFFQRRNEREAAIEREIFGDDAFREAGPQFKLKACLARTQVEVEALVTGPPCEDQELRTRVAHEELGKCIERYIDTYRLVPGEQRGDLYILQPDDNSSESDNA